MRCLTCTHMALGQGCLGVVVHSLKTYLDWFIDTKLDKQLPVPVNRKCSLDVYVNKLKEICAKVVCDQEEGTDDCGRLKKVVEEGGKVTKLKKKNVKYTERKATATNSKNMEKATVSSEKIQGMSLVPWEKNSSVL